MEKTKTQRAKLQQRLDSLAKKHALLMRGRFVPSPAASRVQAEINELKSEIAAIDREAAERLALAKAPVDDVLQIIAIPLLADVINDVVAGVDETLRRNGCQETIFGMYTSQIKRAAMAMVDTLAQTEEGLPRLLDVDDTLVDAVKKKLMSFIKQRLNITA